MYSCLIQYRSNQRSLSSSVLDLRIRPAISFREAHHPFLVVLFLVIPALSLSSMSFLSRSISPLLIQYVFSLPIPRVFAILLTVRQQPITRAATSLFWSLLMANGGGNTLTTPESLFPWWLTLLSLLEVLNIEFTYIFTDRSRHPCLVVFSCFIRSYLEEYAQVNSKMRWCTSHIHIVEYKARRELYTIDNS